MWGNYWGWNSRDKTEPTTSHHARYAYSPPLPLHIPVGDGSEWGVSRVSATRYGSSLSISSFFAVGEPYRVPLLTRRRAPGVRYEGRGARPTAWRKGKWCEWKVNDVNQERTELDYPLFISLRASPYGIGLRSTRADDKERVETVETSRTDRS